MEDNEIADVDIGFKAYPTSYSSIRNGMKGFGKINVMCRLIIRSQLYLMEHPKSAQRRSLLIFWWCLRGISTP
ncbi:hypothetical protein LINGRAHAP2_LOCUS28850, partial [Linum grandiflorum]